jgi:hypothetical protein
MKPQAKSIIVQLLQESEAVQANFLRAVRRLLDTHKKEQKESKADQDPKERSFKETREKKQRTAIEEGNLSPMDYPPLLSAKHIMHTAILQPVYGLQYLK